MDNDLRQRLASAAETDPMAREALTHIEWLDGRPFEEFPAYWDARLSGPSSSRWHSEAASDPLLTDALAYEKTVILRTFDGLKAIAWHRGYVDNSGPRGALDLDEVMRLVRPQYPLAVAQQAYVHGFIEARKLILIKAGMAEFPALAAQLEKLDSIVH
jgi:hypothetical protein